MILHCTDVSVLSTSSSNSEKSVWEDVFPDETIFRKYRMVRFSSTTSTSTISSSPSPFIFIISHCTAAPIPTSPLTNSLSSRKVPLLWNFPAGNPSLATSPINSSSKSDNSVFVSGTPDSTTFLKRQLLELSSVTIITLPPGSSIFKISHCVAVSTAATTFTRRTTMWSTTTLVINYSTGKYK